MTENDLHQLLCIVGIDVEHLGIVHTGIGLIPTDAVEVVVDWGAQ